MDGKHIVSVPHHGGLLVDRVDDGLEEEIYHRTYISSVFCYNLLSPFFTFYRKQ